MLRRYRYVGPANILAKSLGRPRGLEVTSPADVKRWANETGQVPAKDQTLAVTFVIDEIGRLLIADRRSEHVACAGGGDVLSAGEIYFGFDGGRVRVEEVTNQSTGYCPEPESWPAVAAALERAEIAHPSEFTTAYVFRRCDACGQRSIVKDSWFQCDVCGASLPRHWNFDR